MGILCGSDIHICTSHTVLDAAAAAPEGKTDPLWFGMHAGWSCLSIGQFCIPREDVSWQDEALTNA